MSEMTQNLFTRDWQEAEVIAADLARGSQRNVELFEKMFLSLGSDAVEVARSVHDRELNDARNLAAHRWSKLRDMETQIEREEASIKARPKKRGQQLGDDRLASEVIQRLEAKFAEETAAMRAALDDLKEQARTERRELESYVKAR